MATAMIPSMCSVWVVAAGHTRLTGVIAAEDLYSLWEGRCRKEFPWPAFKLGSAVGRVMAHLVTYARQWPWDPHLFGFARFIEDDPVGGR